MPVRRGMPLLVIACLASGCGYSDYIERAQDTLASRDYEDKIENLLGAPIDVSAKGIMLRLPKQVAPTILPETETPEGITAIFQSPPNTANPMRVTIVVSRDTEAGKGLTIAELAQQLFAPDTAPLWMGAGVESLTELRPESRELKAGPKLRRGKQKTTPVQWTTIKQTIGPETLKPPAPENEENEKAPPPSQKPAEPVKIEEFVWKIYLLEQPTVRAMIGFRVRSEDYTRVYSDAIDMSVTTAQLVPAPLKSTTGGGTGAAAPRRR